MASPVIINSSSPNSVHVPSISPPSLRDNSKYARSSSPHLPSPSKFGQPKTSGLKSGSGAQAVPAQAGFGFASVGSLWRERKFEDDAGRDGVQFRREPVSDVSDRAEKSTKSKKPDTVRDAVSGKLKKPRKAARLDAEAKAEGHGQITFELRNFVSDDAELHAEKTPAKAKPSKTVMRPPKQTSESRNPSMDPSEYVFGVYNLGMQTQAPSDASAAEKTRKKAATSRQTKDETTAAKKPRKGRAKSEAVILKSHDPAQDDTYDTNDQTTLASLQHTREGKSKMNKGSKPKRTAARNHYFVNKTVVGPLEPERVSLAPETAPEKSAYFDTRQIPDSINAREASPNPASDMDQVHARDRAVCDLGTVADAAPSRRKEWTPVRDTIVAENVGVTDQDAMSTTASPKLQLMNLLEGFGYTDANSKMLAARRTASGESLTKRRRIEVEGKCAGGPVARGIDAKDDPAGQKEKRKKKGTGKKKLPTITALATSAYQPVLDQTSEQSTVSEFFASREEKEISPKEIATAQEKPKKPRKPRKKKAEAANADQATAAAAKKSKKTRVQFNETDYLTKLHSPARATSQMMQQDFLFGTSSQLVVDESPDFIRDMQAAVEASEIETNQPQRDQHHSQIESSNVVPSQLTKTPRRNKSYAKVPTAPHGTCLSLQQAQRELWCVSSRDNNGGFLRDLSKDAHRENTQVVTETIDAKSVEQPDSLERPEPSELSVEQQVSGITTHDQSASRYRFSDIVPDLPQEFEPAAQATITVSPNDIRCGDDDVVDLCDSSPIARPDDAEDSAIAIGESAEHTGLLKENALQEQPQTGIVSHRTQDEDSWMLISSEGPEFDARVRSPSHSEHSKPSAPHLHSLMAPNVMCRRSSFTGRDILQPLDANASLQSPAAIRPAQVDHARAFATSTSDRTPKSPTGKPRGRPRKENSAPSATAPSPKKRGRPPKEPIPASDPSPETAKFKKPKAAVSASQPLRSPSGWLDVDEISDSDSPITPSPPRRRASASPHATPPLDISIDGSPLAKIADASPAIASAASNFKPGEPQWPAIRDQIFPAITSAIKNAPRVDDPSKPSWYQKILMYDPITLEELTGWLNQQGLRIQAQKQKPKPKKRGRKKRDVDGNVLEEESNTEWEVHEEQLQPWMVQKWCEERSICCVWAGGGWGGRARN